MANKYKILVVEDETIVSMEIQDRLKEMNYLVCGAASSGEEAIRKSAESEPDLVLMDIMLKGKMDGIEAADVVIKEHGIPVIFLTAHSDEATLQRAKLTAPFGYLLKPFNDRALHTTIEMALYRHEMEKKVRDSEKWLSTTLTSLNEGVITTDKSGKIKFINPIAEKMTGWSATDAVSLKVSEVFKIFSEKDHEKLDCPVHSILNDSQNNKSNYSSLLTNKNGKEFLIDHFESLIKNHKDKTIGAILVFRDISERRRLEDQFHQAQKMESIGLLAGGVAHDFNNILSAILGYASFMKMKMNEDHPFFNYVDTIEKSAIRGADLTAQLLSFARKGQLNIKSLDLNAVVSEALKVVKSTFDRSIEIETTFFPALPTIDIDEIKMQQILMNLFVNARDAMPKGGKLTIETNIARFTGKRNDLTLDLEPGVYAVLSVADTGTGIDEKILKSIFEPFFTTKEKGKGTGLGLSMVYGVVKNLKGDIQVDSKIGKGTRFNIYLPISGKPEQKDHLELDAPLGKGETILVVDDEETIRDFVDLSFKKNGYKVILAENGLEGVKVFKKNKDNIDLVILDLVMPKMGGFEAYEEMRKISPKTKFIYTTGYTEDIKMKEITKSGIDGFLRKPCQIKELLSETRRVLDMKKPEK